MNIIAPIEVTDAMLTASSIAEPAAGEVVWSSGGTYALGDRRIRATTHRVYEASQAHSGRTTPPEDDAAYWFDYGPTQKWAPFDAYTSTQASTTGSISYTAQPGFFDAVSLYGLQGGTLTLTVKDEPGGAVIYGGTPIDLYEQATGFYELLFLPLRQKTKVVFTNIPIAPDAEVIVLVNAGGGNPVKVGMLNFGVKRPLFGDAWGGTQYGAGAEPKTYSYIKFFDDGTAEIKRRGAATDLSASVIMPADQAAGVTSILQEVLDVPVTCFALNEQGFDYLNVFGLISARVTAEGAAHARLDFNAKGFV